MSSRLGGRRSGKGKRRFERRFDGVEITLSRHIETDAQIIPTRSGDLFFPTRNDPRFIRASILFWDS